MSRRNEVSYTECKTFGHRWDDAPPSTQTTVERGFVLRCDGCHTVRHDHIGRYGELEGRSYDYPQDYRDVGEKLTRDELRLAMMKIHGVKRRNLRRVS